MRFLFMIVQREGYCEKQQAIEMRRNQNRLLALNLLLPKKDTDLVIIFVTVKKRVKAKVKMQKINSQRINTQENSTLVIYSQHKQLIKFLKH